MGYLFTSLWAQYKLFVLFWKSIPLLWLKSNGSQFENEKVYSKKISLEIE